MMAPSIITCGINVVEYGAKTRQTPQDPPSPQPIGGKTLSMTSWIVPTGSLADLGVILKHHKVWTNGLQKMKFSSALLSLRRENLGVCHARWPITPAPQSLSALTAFPNLNQNLYGVLESESESSAAVSRTVSTSGRRAIKRVH
ncbi:hypothetical protein Baya_13022 [Bagarius yarrelli]|uniref:Uncharacterized protein n=1 Tax=Bagarius yarrelli TaxID=175774 RepID=A0A556V528_BAGYA|nr:hypothetical protein Baya_13022 [Bagarius yarrelli]